MTDPESNTEYSGITCLFNSSLTYMDTKYSGEISTEFGEVGSIPAVSTLMLIGATKPIER